MTAAAGMKASPMRAKVTPEVLADVNAATIKARMPSPTKQSSMSRFFMTAIVKGEAPGAQTGRMPKGEGARP
ncbi:hypothetical protein GCM10023334_053770 [Nonomuraea thailandensis]